MDYDAQLKLQAYLDGELPEGEAREMATRLAQDPEAVGLLGELRQTRQWLKASEAPVTLPESREFFWSKIQREVQRQGQPTPVPQVPSFIYRLRQILVPLSAVAAMALVGLVAVTQSGLLGGSAVSESESSMADTGAFTYHDYTAQATLVWFSYPAENEIAEPEPAAKVD
jgi:anti-sigma factor RsiW